MIRAFAAAFLIFTFSAGAAGRGKGHAGAQDLRFAPSDVPIIVEYYGRANNLPPGLAKRNGDLPPGLAKRGGNLPPGLQKRFQPFPRDLEVRLGPPPPGCRRVIVDSRALLIQDATNVVLDILDLTRRR